MDRALRASAPVLSASLLASIHELNRDYVDLLVAERNSPAAVSQLQHLPARLAPELAALTPRARRDLASAPFTLYSLGLEDDVFWRAACEIDASTIEQRYVRPGAASLQGSFCEAALLHAWRVAGSNPLAAAMVYAMQAPTAQRLAAAAVWRIKRIANDYPGLLTPRWPTNPAFWPDLVQFAAENDARRLRAAQLLGHQLIAAELDCEMQANGRMSGPPQLRSPRLRAGKVRFELSARIK
jgi:hypothetical protein